MPEGILNQVASPNAELDPFGAELDRIRDQEGTPAIWAAAALTGLLVVHAMHYPLPLYGPAADEDHPDACPHDPDSDWDEHFEGDDGAWLCESRPMGAECRCGEEWPCPEYSAVLAALTGKAADSAEG